MPAVSVFAKSRAAARGGAAGAGEATVCVKSAAAAAGATASSRLPQSLQKRNSAELPRPQRSQRRPGPELLPKSVTAELHLSASPTRERIAHLEHELERHHVREPETEKAVRAILTSAVRELPQQQGAVHGGEAYHGRLGDLKL